MGVKGGRLKIPEFLKGDSAAEEILSVWKLNGPQTVLVEPGTWDDPAAWGLLLVDIARHVSKAFEQNTDISKQDAFKRIMEGFNAEISSPTDDF
jgi:hypothetical protein